MRFPFVSLWLSPRFFRPVCSALILLATIASTLGAAAPAKPASAPRPKRIYQATRLAGAPPAIDGRLGEACWREQGAWSSGYTQFTPTYEAKPSHPTEIKILFDARNLYVAMRAHDDAPARRSRQAGDRDEFVGDIMGVTFDSYHDLRTAFEFDLTASGQKIDLRLNNESWDTTWNAVWEGKVAHEDASWTAEFLIPLNQLRYSPANRVWGLHSWRWIDRHKEESDWQLLANDDSGFVRSFGELHGLEDLPSLRRVELVPYASVATETGARRDTRLRGGLDAKIGLTSNLTLDASLLPDFGQVEADPSVMNLSAFETFLTERRPLFLEGKDILETDFNDDSMFYSRRIGQPAGVSPAGTVLAAPDSTTLLGALKLTGKTTGGFSFGALAAATDAEEALVRDAAGHTGSVPVAPRAAQLVARGQQDFRHGDTVVGAIVTHVQRDNATDLLRTSLAERATTGGVDLTHYWAARKYFFRASAIGSVVRGEPAAIARLQRSSARYYQRPIDGRSEFDAARRSLTGTGLWLKGGRASQGHWRFHEELAIKTPGLELNDLGYLSIADRIEQQTALAYIERKPARWYRSYEFEFMQQSERTTRGEFLGTEWDLDASVELKNKWNLYAGLEFAGPGRDPVALRGGPLLRVPARYEGSFSVSTDGSRRISGRLSGNFMRSDGDLFRRDNLGARLNLRPVPALLLTLSADATRQVDHLRYVRLTPVSGPDGWFVSRLDGVSRSLSLRAQWIVRPELRLQYYGNPFGSTVRYSEFRRVLAPDAAAEAQRFGTVLPGTASGGLYSFDEDRDGRIDYQLGDPDGNTGSLRSNFVLKWEYRRGSMLYLVWSQQRDGAASGKDVSATSALSGIRHVGPNNQFMVKVTYWFSS